jgi:hypothetical protein
MIIQAIRPVKKIPIKVQLPPKLAILSATRSPKVS